MGAEVRASNPLYEGPHLRVSEFVEKGHLGGAWEWAAHTHQTMQITIVSRHSSLQANWVNDCGSKRRKRISGPAVCVTPAFQRHSMEWDEAHGSIIMLISPDLLGGELRSNSIIQESYGGCDPFLEHLGNLSTRGRDAGMPFSRIYAESTAVILLEHLGRHAAPSRAREYSGCGRLGQVIDYINANLAAELSIVELARIAQASPFHFARGFKASTGVTPHQYVLERRIETAKSLLAAGHLSIADVSYACGFATQAHLTTVFRRLVGVTPKAYRMCAV